jgi:hypothetical protein
MTTEPLENSNSNKIVWDKQDPGTIVWDKPLVAKDGMTPEIENFAKNLIGDAWRTAENIGHVYPVAEAAATLITNVYGLPLSGIAGLFAAPFGLEKAQDAIEAVSEALIYQPQTQRGKELVEGAFYPFRALEELGGKLGNEVLEATNSPYLASATHTLIAAAPAFVGVRGVPKKVGAAIAKTDTWRRMTIKERGLVIQSLEETIKKNPEMSEGQILRKWEGLKKEATQKRAVGEETTKPVEGKPTKTEATKPQEAVGSGKATIEKPTVEPPDWVDPFSNKSFSDLARERAAEKAALEPKAEVIKGEVEESVYEQNRKVGKPKVSQRVPKAVKEMKRGVGKTVDEYLGTLSTRVGIIHQGAKTKLRRFEFSVRKTQKADVKAVEPMLKRSTKEMTPEDLADFDLARKNADTAKIQGLVKKYGIEEEYKATRKVLDDIHKRAKEVGFEVQYLKEYHPRTIKDPQGLLEHFQKGEDWPVIQKAIETKEAELGRYLSVEEKAQVANSMLRGEYRGKAGPGAFRGRKIKLVDSELNKFYDTSDSSLINYLRRVNEQIEVRRFFGKGVKTKDFTNIEDSIGAYVIELIAEEKIRPDQEAELTKLLQARFQAQGPGKIVGLYRDLSYIDTMGSVVSAITQIGDLAWAVYENGTAGATAGAWASIKGQPLLTKEDVGVEQIAQEFTNPTKASKAVAKVFRLTGLEQIDRVGKETLMHSTIRKYQKIARDPKKVSDLRKDLKPIFEDETGQLVKDLKGGELTENVEFLAFYTLLDYQPVALSEMPEKYLTSKDGRIFYMLKTFTLKQFDVFRREAFQKIKTGEPKQVKQGMKNLVRLAFAFIVMNAGADAIKNLILGRPMDLGDLAVDNILRTLGVSKFLAWKAREEGVGSAAGRQILPPFKFIDSIYKDITRGIAKGSEIVQSLPLVGKLYYWWFGRGAEKSRKKANKDKL